MNVQIKRDLIQLKSNKKKRQKQKQTNSHMKYIYAISKFKWYISLSPSCIYASIIQCRLKVSIVSFGGGENI